MTLFLKLATASLFAAGLASAASGGQLVIGESAAATCYQSAKAQNYSYSAYLTCTDALETDLSLKDRASTHINRGIIAAGGGRLDDAFSDYQTAIRLRPELGEGYANRGTVYRNRDRLDDALADFNKALSLGVKEPHLVYFNRAVTLEQTGRVTEAYYDYRKAAELAPDWALPKEELERFTVSETG